MKPLTPLLACLALLPALAHAHAGHPGHDHAAGLADSPVLGLLAGLAVFVVLLAAHSLPRRSRITAKRPR